jgi:hypothetical protein
MSNTNIWTPEFEELWRCRLVEMNDEKQPFREFIGMVVEMEVLEAFKMALNEISRLRRQTTQM